MGTSININLNCIPSNISVNIPSRGSKFEPQPLYRPSGVETDRPRVDTDRPRVYTDRPRVDTDRPRVDTDRPRVYTDRPRVDTDQPRVDTDRPRVDTDRPCVDTDRPCVDTDRPRVDTERPRVGIGSPSYLMLSQYCAVCTVRRFGEGGSKHANSSYLSWVILIIINL